MHSIGYIPRKNIVKDLLFRLLGYPSFMRRLQAPVLLSFLSCKRDCAILDVGCGSGWLSRELSRYGKRVTGVDININPDEVNYRKSANLSFVQCDGQRLPFHEGAFDRVMLSGVLQMVPDDRILLREVKRVLAHGGKMAMSVPLGYRYLKRLYSSKIVARTILNILIRTCDFPSSLEDLKVRLGGKFGVHGKGYYTMEGVVALCEEEGFELRDKRCAPALCASFVHEIWLIAALIFGFNPSSRALFLMFPLFWWERFIPSKHGDEIVLGFDSK